jgi:hypothetical protein
MTTKTIDAVPIVRNGIIIARAKPFQPYTTEATARGMLIARNATRLRLWADPEAAHRFLCHPGEECEDGCSGGYPRDWMQRQALLNSDLETDEP